VETTHQNLIKDIKHYNLEEKFPNYKIYKWGTFGNPDANDLDLIFIGKMDNSIAEKLWKFWKTIGVGFKLDITVLPNNTLFNHIERFNNHQGTYHFDEKIIRYKLWCLKNNEEHGRILTKHENYYEIEQLFARKDFKYEKVGWPTPTLLKDYV
jgi:hypothetical protein